MQIDKNYKLERVASQDKTRPRIENILITKDKDQVVAIATDGRCMAIVPATIEADHELGLISPQALTYARKASKNLDHVQVELNGDCKFIDNASLPRPDEKENPFPDWKTVRAGAMSGEVKFTVALDPELLLKLAEGLGRHKGNKAVTLAFVDPESPIRVRVQGEQGTGILMPARVS